MILKIHGQHYMILNLLNTTTWKPEIADKYVIWVDVIDEDGDYASKSIEVTVIE